MNHAPIKPPIPSATTHPPRIRRPLPILVAAIAAVALHGCEPNATDHRVTGVIPFDEPRIPDWPPPQIPGTATAGVPLELTLWTAGGIGCGHMRRGNTEVTPLGRSALVVPFDILTTHEGGFLQPVEDPGCFGILRSFEHTATVVFEEPGTAEIVLVYSTDGGALPEDFTGDGRRVYTVEVSAPGSKADLTLRQP